MAYWHAPRTESASRLLADWPTSPTGPCVKLAPHHGVHQPQCLGSIKDDLVYTAYTFSRSKDELAKLATDGKLPHADQSSVQQCRFTITLTQKPEEDVALLHRTTMPDQIKALQLANLSHSPTMDVRLLFKRAGDLELELWTTADFLGKPPGTTKPFLRPARRRRSRAAGRNVHAARVLSPSRSLSLPATAPI